MFPRALALCLALAGVGCAGHSARTEAARSALDAGDTKRALRLLDEELGVASGAELPEDVGGDAALLLLDRAVVLQSLATTGRAEAPREYAWSSRDLETADKQVEILDLSRGAGAAIGKYLFSDDSGPYRAPAYEKLLINTLNLVNYLARGDLSGARVEARRLAVMQKFIDEHEGHGASLTGPGSYLAGFAFERSGKPEEALRFYDEALEHGAFSFLEAPVRRLSAHAGYRSPRLRRLLGEAPAPGASAGADATAAPPVSAPAPAAPAEGEGDPQAADLLVIVGYGRVPPKIARRIPIGLALTYASGALAAGDQARANTLAAQGLVTWINFPELGRARGTWGTPAFSLDGRWQRLEGALAVDDEARRVWDDARGTVVASAITRMVARVVAGEAVRRSTGGVVGVLLSLGTQATLTAVDTPDTRSWATLPARIAIGRLRVAPGRHRIVLRAGGVTVEREVALDPGGFAVIPLTMPR